MTFTASRRLPILLIAALTMVALYLVGGPVQAQDNTAPAAPTGLTVAEVAHDSVQLTWDDPGDATITHYQVLQRDRDRDALGVFTTIEQNTGSADTEYTDRDVEPEGSYVYRVKAVNQHGVSSESTYARADVPAAPLTAEFVDEPETHNGAAAFTFRIAFSDDISISYRTLRDDSLEVTGGTVTRARRVNGSSALWEITVEPGSGDSVTVTLPETTDCAAQGAVCTSDGRMLSASVKLTVTGPGSSRRGEFLPLSEALTSVSAVSTGQQTATATVELPNPDSESLTVHLRYSADSRTAWSTPAMGTTTGTSVEFSLSGLSPNAEYDLQASLDGTFGDGTEVSATFVNRPAQRDIDTLAAGNTHLSGLWSDGTTMWVADSGDNKLYAYMLATGERDADKDFDTLVGAGNISPWGLWSDGTTMWVADYSDDKLYAYKMSDKARDSGKDFDTLGAAGNTLPWGIWSDGTTMWVEDSSDAKLYAYKMSDKARDADKDFDTLAAAGNTSPSGIWSDGTTMWVAGQYEDKLYAYVLATGARVSGRDFDTLEAAGNERPYGIWSDGATLWVADWTDDKLYAYYLPPHVAEVVAEVSATSTGQQTATATVELLNPDSESLTVHLRYSADSRTAWSTPAMGTTTGTSVEFSLSGLSPNAEYDLQASLDGTFGDGTEVSAVFVNRPAQRDIDTLAAGNTSPTGIWSDGTTTIWVADSGDDKLFAYVLASGERDADKDFDTLVGAGNNDPTGIWSDGTTMWVADDDVDAKLYAYTLADGARDSGKDFDTLGAAGNNNPTGIWSDGTTMWVADYSDDKLYAYKMSDKARDSGKDFDTQAAAGNTSPSGIWSDGTTMWVAGQYEDKLYAYVLATGARVSGRDVDTLEAAGRERPYGIGSDGATMWVAVFSSFGYSKLYAYYLPPHVAEVVAEVSATSTGQQTATATVELLNPDSESLTVHLRYSADSRTAWSTPAMGTTTGTSVEFSLSGLSPNAGYDLQASLDGTFGDGTEVSAVFVNRLAQRDIDTLAAGNTSPTGLWSDGTTMWVADSGDDKLYAYMLATGERDADKDFDTLVGAGNISPWGLWSDGTTMWVADYSDDKLYAYKMSDKARDSGKDFDTQAAAGNTSPSGIWSDGTTMWVEDYGDDKLYAYKMSDKARDADKDFDTLAAAGNNNPFGLWSDGATMWVADPGDAKLYAYKMSDKARDADKDFDTLNAAGNDEPRGLWSDGATVWVADPRDDKLYAYYLPLYEAPTGVSAVSTGRETATATVELLNPDSESLTVHLRYSDDDGTSWSTPATATTTGTSVEFSLSGLSPNAEYDLQASLDGTFADGTETEAIFVNRPAERDMDALAAAGNNNPAGIWSDGTTIWVADYPDEKLYAYVLTSGVRDPGKDFDTLGAAGNGHPLGIWSDGTTIWVADYPDAKLYAYVLASGVRDSDKDFDTLDGAGNDDPTGIWSDGTTIWVADFVDAKLYAYVLASGVRDSDKDFDTLDGAGNDDPFGLWSDGATMWVADSTDEKLYAYVLASGVRDSDKDFDTLDGAGNDDPFGIGSDGATMWVADETDEKLYAYYLPQYATEVSAASTGRETATATVELLNPDSESLTVHLRYSDDDGTSWSTPATATTTGTSAELSLSGLEPNGEYDLQASLDGTFGDGTETEAIFVNRPAHQDIDTLAAVDGIWSDGTTMWVTDWVNDKLQAYTLATGARDAGKDIDTLNAAGNDEPRGLWSDGATMWVVDESATYLLACTLADGSRDSGKDIATLVAAGNHNPYGLWSDGTTIWVSDVFDAKLYAYVLASGERDADKDFDTLAAAGNNAPSGIWSDGATMWVADQDERKLFAYTLDGYLSTRPPEPSGDVNSLIAAGNTHAGGVWSDGATVWVADWGDGKLYAYYQRESKNSNLSALSVDGVGTAGFDSYTSSYQFGVASSLARVTVEGVAQERDATVAFSGVDADGGTDGHQVDLVEGRNVVTVTVTAEDGVSRAVYTVSVNRGSDAPYGWRAEDDLDTLRTAGNNEPYGIWSDGETIWAADWEDSVLDAYSLATGARDADRDIDLAVGNDSLTGLWSDGTTMWVADSTDDKLYAYVLTSGVRDAGKDLDTLVAAGNDEPRGIWSDGTTIWVADYADAKLYAYTLADGARDADKDLDTLAAAGNDDPTGIWSDGATMWVADIDDSKIYAYKMSDKARDSGRDFDTLAADGNDDPTGIWSDGATIWVADSGDDKLYAYNMPANNAPEFSDGASTTRSVAENTASSSNVGSAVAATDADGDTLTYTLGGTDAASFSIVGASGQIQTSAALDHETKSSYSVTVSVADGEGGTDTIAVTISVTDESEPPDAPGAPTVAATSNTTTSLDVSWTAPGLNGGPALTGYEVRYRISGSWIDWTHSGTGTSATITGLTASTTYQVQVRALNGETPSDWSSTGAGSTGTPANNAPEFSDGASTTRSVAENTASSSNVGSAVAATDADGDTLTYTLGGTDAASFSIVGASGQIQTSAALDHETKSSYSVTVSVADGKNGTDTIGVTINVTDVNEKPATPGAPTVTATSNTTTSLDVSWTAPGLNGGPALTGYEVRYRISGSWIDWTHSGTGTSATITGLTASTTYQVQVRALNGETPSDWSSTGAGSTGTPANNAPEFSDGASTTRSVAENTASSSNVGSAVAATDSDGDTLTYTLGGTDAASFSIVGASGQIQTSAALDHETKSSYSVTVSVADGKNGTDTIGVTINVTDVNEKPATPGAPTVTATSNTTTSLDVSWTAPGLNGGPALTGYEVRYRISGSWIDWTHSGTGTSATITGLTASTTYQVQVRALNGETPSDWSSTGAGSTGTPANNAPEFSDGASTTRSVAENTASSSNVGSAVAATDADGDTLTYTLGGTDAASFSIVGASGQIQTSAALDHETKSSYSVTVSVADGEGGTDTIAVTISVTDESEPPDAPGAPTVAATSNTTTSLDVSWTAPGLNGGPALTGYEVRYRISGSWIDWTHSGTGTSATITGLTASTTYQVQVRALNGETPSDWSSTGAGSTGTPANNAPEFSDGASTTRSVAENTASSSNVGSAVAATDADGDTLTYTLGGTDAASFSIVGASGQIQTSAALDHETKSSYSVTVSVADGEGGTDTIAVTISVTDESEPPDAPGAPTVAATSGATDSLDVSWSAPDTAGRPAISDYDVQYRKSGDTAWTDHAHTGTSTTTTIGSLDSGTTYQVQVRATNAEGTSGWSATGTGSTDNSAPAFASDTTTRSVDENTASGANVGSAVTATDSDGDTLTYTLGGTDAASFSIVGASGQIQTSAALDHETKSSYSVTVSVADGEGGTDTIAVTISVTDESEPPDAPGAPTVAATSGATDSLDVSWSAPDTAGRPAISDYDVQYRKSGDTAWTDHAHTGTSTTTTIGSLDSGTTYQVQVRATNAEGTSGWSATGTGSTDNSAPAFASDTTTRSVDENTASGANVGSAVTATDSDGDTLTYTLGGTDAASFSIVGASGQIQTSAALDHETKSSYSVTVSVADGKNGTDTIGVTINVTDVNEKPATPGAPTVTATSNTTTSLDVSWTAPGLNGGPALTGYEVRYRISGSWIDWTHSGTGTSATITGLTASTTYQVQVRALNGETPSDWSSTGAGSTGTPANNAPEFSDGASTTRSVAENTASSSNVGSAVAATDSDGDTLTYTLGGTDAASFSIVGASGQIQTSAALDHETKSSYSVTVSVADGEGGTDTIAVTISVTDESEPPDAPGAPTVAATSGATDSLDVSWSAPDTAGRPAISDYDVQYRKSGDTAWTDHAHTGTSTTTTIGSLDSGTTYQVQVRATNAEGTSGWSATGTGSILGPPDAPPNVQASGNAELTVTWDAPNDGGSAITGYTVQLKLSSISGWPSGSVTERTLTGTPPARSHTFTGLTNGTEYTVRVKATNIHGDSDWSDEAGGTPSSKPPPSVTITTGADQPIDGPFAVTITFNEEVEGFACADEPPDPNEVACDIGAGYVGGALVDVVDLQEAGVNPNSEHVFTARVEDILTGTLVVWVHKGKARAVDGGLPNAFGALQVEVKALDQVPQQPVTTVWQASMDVEDVGGYLGYGKAGGHSGGSLTGDTFSWSGQEYTVEALLYNQAIGEVILELSRALPNDGRRMALLIGNYWLDTSNPEPYTHTVAGKDGWGYRWHPVAPYLEAGHANVPVKLVRQAIGASSAQGEAFLSWGDPGDDTITGYRIERRDRDGDEGFTALVDDTGSDDTGYTDRSVEGGGRYAYRVTAMNDAGESEPSGEAHVDVPARPNSPARGAPTISGTAQVGETLTADTDGIEDDDGLADAVYSYQWLADDADVAGATSDTYTLVADDVGKAIKVKVSFRDDRNDEESLTSAATAAVTAADESAVWSATLTVGSIAGFRGFWKDVGLGELTSEVFTLDGVDYTVKVLADSDGPQFYLTLDKALPVGFTLQVGATTLSSQGASIREFSSGATQYGWATNQGAILADVDTVEVSLTLAE